VFLGDTDLEADLGPPPPVLSTKSELKLVARKATAAKILIPVRATCGK
jgi:hypothetical protein